MVIGRAPPKNKICDQFVIEQGKLILGMWRLLECEMDLDMHWWREVYERVR